MTSGDYYEKLSDNNGKDDWSFVCSQMDWIEAWVNELECIKTWNNSSSHRDTVNISQFILGVDMIVTASKNLLEFFQVDIKTLVESHEVFQDNKTDLGYFRRIRNECAVHPIDIQGRNRIRERCSSWICSLEKGAFTIFIYSLKPNTPAEMLVVKRDKLIKFANRWYSKIEELNRKLSSSHSGNSIFI